MTTLVSVFFVYSSHFVLQVDVLKMWLSWQALGETGLEAYVNHKMDLAKYLAKIIEANSNFILILQVSCDRMVICRYCMIATPTESCCSYSQL